MSVGKRWSTEMPPLLKQPLTIESFESLGFLKVRVDSAVTDLISRIFAMTPSFFRRGKAEKLRDSIPSLHEGWHDLGGEFSIVPERPDLHESFWVTPKFENKVKMIYSPLGLSLYKEMRKYIRIMAQIERGITRSLVVHVTGNRNAKAEFCCDFDSDLQSIYYQPYLHSRECLQEPHDDSLYMTFIKANLPGLELDVGNGNYRSIVLDHDEILVMPGEILALLSGFKIKPQIHRVVRHENQLERLALGYFTYPNIDVTRTIRPWILNETNEDVDIMQRVIENQSQFLVEPAKPLRRSEPGDTCVGTGCCDRKRPE